MNRRTPPAKSAPEPDLEDIEVPLLLEALYQRWGYDFRGYALTSLKRRTQRIVELEGVSSVSALQERLLRNPACVQRFIDQITVNVTAMFRDPSVFRAFRAVVAPLLKRRRMLRIWHAGCGSGEEVYSLAILLHEEDLLDRARIYATDLNQTLLDTAKEGIYPLEKMQEYTQNYQAGGGKAAFSEYYQVGHGHAMMRAELSKNIFWAQHNLVTDASFNEFHLILCRNVLIYFNSDLQERVHRLLYDSLMEDGLLVLGKQENLQLVPYQSCYQALDSREKIYRRINIA